MTLADRALGEQFAPKWAGAEHPWIAVKNPSIVRLEDRWHLFCTRRENELGDGRMRIGYLWSRR